MGVSNPRNSSRIRKAKVFLRVDRWVFLVQSVNSVLPYHFLSLPNGRFSQRTKGKIFANAMSINSSRLVDLNGNTTVLIRRRFHPHVTVQLRRTSRTIHPRVTNYYRNHVSFHQVVNMVVSSPSITSGTLNLRAPFNAIRVARDQDSTFGKGTTNVNSNYYHRYIRSIVTPQCIRSRIPRFFTVLVSKRVRLTLSMVGIFNLVIHQLFGTVQCVAPFHL